MVRVEGNTSRRSPYTTCADGRQVIVGLRAAGREGRGDAH